MFRHYFETPLEQWIRNKYIRHQILFPTDLDIEHIAQSFGIELIFESCPPFSDTEEAVIFLDKRSDELTRRTVFYHELCHVLRHSGDQRRMPRLFREAQEADADAFLLYAAIPYYMLKSLELPGTRSEVAEFIAMTFQVTPTLAAQRLNQIMRREYNGMFLETAVGQSFSTYADYAEESQVKNKVYAFCDPGMDTPTQLLVHVAGNDWHKEEMRIPLFTDYAQIDNADHLSASPVSPFDFVCRDGHIVLKLRRLAARYGAAPRNLVVQMKDINTALEF